MEEESKSQKIVAEIAEHYKAILELIGEDTTRDGLVKTPERAARALLYVTRGYNQDVETVIHGALFDAAGDKQLVVVKDIEFYSLCEHHILPFFGHVSIGYVPGLKIVGLSKVARIVDMYARRLQVQERLTSELVDVFSRVLGAEGVIVQVKARHLCMAMRGVQKQESVTVTTASSGVLKTDQSLRNEFFMSLR